MGKKMCRIGGVDVTEYWVGMEGLRPSGPGSVGEAQLQFEQEAGGLTIEPRMLAEVWEAYDDLGNGVLDRGRYLLGIVINRLTSSESNIKTWDLDCVDVNILLKELRLDADSTLMSIPAGLSFPAAVALAVQTVQRNGYGAVAIPIDTSGVEDLIPGETMPFYGGGSGKTLGEILGELCVEAVRLNPDLRPRMRIGPGTSSGPAATMGGPVLYIYDGATATSPLYTFSNAPTGAQKEKYGQVTREVLSDGLVQRRQSLYTTPEGTLVLTYEDAASGALYPNPFQNHGLTGNKGYWQGPPIEDTDSEDEETAELRLQLDVLSTSAPAEIYDHITNLRVLPGDVVAEIDDLEFSGTVNYRVAAVAIDVARDTDPEYKIQLGSRRLELLETRQLDALTLPAGGVATPEPPSVPVLGATTWNEATQLWQPSLSWTPSQSRNVIQQWLMDQNRGVRAQLEAVVNSYVDTIPPLTSYVYYLVAVGRSGWSRPGPTVTGTTLAAPAMLPPTVVNVTTPGTFNPAISETEVPYTITASAYGVGGNEATWTENGVARKQWLGFTLSSKLLMSPGVLVSQLKFWAYGYDQTRSAATAAVVDFTTASHSGAGITLVDNWSFEDTKPGYISSDSDIFPGWIGRKAGIASMPNVAVGTGGHGAQGCLLSAGGASGILHNRYIPVSAAKTYAFELYAFNYNHWVRIYWYNASKVALGGASAYTDVAVNASADSTHHARYLVTPPAGAYFARPDIYQDGGAQLTIDSIVFAPVASTVGAGLMSAADKTTLDALPTSNFTTSGKVTAGGAVDGTITRRFHARGTNAGIHLDEVGAGGSSEGFYSYAQRTGGAGTQKFRLGTAGADKFSVDQNGIVAAAYGYQSLGTANFTFGGFFPALPASGDFHYHTTHRVICSYDGTRWLGPEQISSFGWMLPSGSTYPIPNTATGDALYPYIIALPMDRGVYITRWNTRYRVRTTNNSTNYWTARLEISGVAVIATMNTSTGPTGQWENSTVTSFSNNPTNNSTHKGLDVGLSPTGAPGTIDLTVLITYHKVYT